MCTDYFCFCTCIEREDRNNKKELLQYTRSGADAGQLLPSQRRRRKFTLGSVFNFTPAKKLVSLSLLSLTGVLIECWGREFESQMMERTAV